MVATNNFSAEQILEAGRRAEAEGNRDHAFRFYSHIVGQFAGTTEAAEAYAGMQRLGEPARTAPPTQPVSSSQPQGWQAAPGQRPQGVAYGVLPGPNPLTAASPSGRPWSDAAPQLSAPRQMAGDPAAFGRDATRQAPARKKKRPTEPVAETIDDDDMDAPAPRYRLGFLLAWCLSLIGGVGLVAGLVMLAAGQALPVSRTANTLLGAAAVSPALCLTVVLVSMALLLLGLMGRALFTLARALQTGSR